MDPNCPLRDETARCPATETLAELAAGRLDAAGESELAGVLDRCGRCRDRLDEQLGRIVPVGLADSDMATLGSDPRMSAAKGEGHLPAWIGPYRILERLGEGGFGVVYAARQDEPIRRRVALKVLKAGMDSKAVLARFEAERQALALMDHANIAKIIDAGETERGRPYFAMELVKGVSITRYCDDNRLRLNERIDLFVSVCDAIQHAHQKGVIHRDIKPTNVLVTEVDGVAVPKVIDFGIAKAVSQPLSTQTLITRQGQLIGTLEYMSPEQAGVTACDVDTRADVYSLGILLYELLTGTLPFSKQQFKEASLAEIQRIIREVDAPKPSTRLLTLGEAGVDTARRRRLETGSLTRRLRGELDWILATCLEKDRARRYASAAGLADELRRFRNGEAVAAGPPTATYRILRFVRRHRLGVGVAAAMVAVLLAGLVSTSLAMVKARAAERLAAERYEAMVELKADATRQRDVAVSAERRATVLLEDLRRKAYAANIQAATLTLGLSPLPDPADLRRLDAADVAAARGYLQRCPPDQRGWEWRVIAGLVDRSLRCDDNESVNVSGVAISPDGKRSATTDLAGYVTIRSLDTGRVEQRFWAHRDGLGAVDVAFLPDGSQILTCGWNDPYVLQWTPGSPLPTARLESGARGVVNLAVSPDGRSVAGGTASGRIVLWDLADESPTISSTRSHGEGWVRDLVFHPSGRFFASAGNDGTVRLWSPEQDEPLAVLNPPSADDTSAACGAVAFDDRGRWIAVGRGGRVAVWRLTETPTGAEPAATWSAPAGADVTKIAFLPGTADFLSTDEDGTICVWRAADGSGSPQWSEVSRLYGHTDRITGLSVAPDGRRAVTSSDDGSARLWALSPRRKTSDPWVGRGAVRHLTIPGAKQTAATWLGNSGRLLSVSSGGSSSSLWVHCLTLDDAEAPASTSALEAAGPAWDFLYLNPIATDPEGRRAAVPNNTARIPLFTLSPTGSVERVEVFAPDEDRWHDVAFASDGGNIAVSQTAGRVSVWSPDGRQLLRRLDHGGDAVVQCVAYSRDGSVLATGGDDHRVLLWSTDSDQPLAALDGHAAAIWALAFSPDGERLATATRDGVIHIWRWRDRELEREIADAHERFITGLTFDASGERLLSVGGIDRTLRVWDADSGEGLMRLEGLPERPWSIGVGGPADAVVLSFNAHPPLLLVPREAAVH